ncbi:hypothetical protein V8E54_004913 [Elaphomyces granulatus]
MALLLDRRDAQIQITSDMICGTFNKLLLDRRGGQSCSKQLSKWGRSDGTAAGSMRCDQRSLRMWSKLLQAIGE